MKAGGGCSSLCVLPPFEPFPASHSDCPFSSLLPTLFVSPSRPSQTYYGFFALQEGIFTLSIGLLSFFMLPPSPSETKSRWRPNGLFSEKEVKIIVNRVIRDDPGKGTMHVSLTSSRVVVVDVVDEVVPDFYLCLQNRQALTPKLLWKSMCDFDLWPMYILALTCSSFPSDPLFP
jgi:hypothetical protein